MNFSVSEGEIFGFLGPSGAGKSTLQKILLGMLPGYQGSAMVNGMECRNHGVDFYESAMLYQDLNNHTHKHSNRGNTPDELLATRNGGQKSVPGNALTGQLSLFDEGASAPKLTISGKAAQNALCPCGGGRKYKNCCGKGK